MEDPAGEIRDVIRGLVERPTFKRQAEVLEKYFTEDVEFKHIYINIGNGRDDLIAIYQYAEFLVNYQHVEFKRVVYDPVIDVLDVEMGVLVRPWLLLWRPTTLEFNTVLELRDVHDEATGKTLKKVKAQRDYFIRAPLIQLIPIIGQIYDSNTLRNIGGSTLATIVRVVRGVYRNVVPSKLQSALFSFWDTDLSVPPFKRFERGLKAAQAA